MTALDRIVDVRLRSGLRVVAVERPGPPTVAVRFSVGLPGLDRSGRAALDVLVRRMLDGPEQATAGATVRRRLAEAGATGEASVEGGVLTVALSALTDGLEAVLEILAAAVTDTGLTAAAVHPGAVPDPARSTVDGELERIVLDRRFPGRVCGTDGPGPTTTGSPRELWCSRVVPGRASLVLVGPIGTRRLAGSASTTFADWVGPVPGEPPPVAVRSPPTGEIVVVRRGGPGGVVLLGGPGLPLGDPDELVARVANLVLAGPASARLGRELRDRRGVAYGVTAQLRHDPEGDWNAVRVTCAGDRLEAVLDGARGVLRDLATEGATAEEVATARELAAATPALATAGQSTLAAALAGFVVAGADPGDLTRARSRALAVTGSDVRGYCAEALRPDRFDGAAAVPAGAGTGGGCWRPVEGEPA